MGRAMAQTAARQFFQNMLPDCNASIASNCARLNGNSHRSCEYDTLSKTPYWPSWRTVTVSPISEDTRSALTCRAIERFLHRDDGPAWRGHLNGRANRAISPARIGAVLILPGGRL